MSMIEEALEIALRGHRGQVDKGGQPYILHPIYVMNRMITEEEKVVALLHDVLEDTDVPLSELQEKFPVRVVEAVVALTRREGETYRQFIERISVNELARVVKRQDLKHNMDPKRIIPGMAQEQRDSLFKRYMRALAYLETVGGLNG